MNLFQIPCFFRAGFGISCPGCGMTRAAKAALAGNFSASVNFHPLLFYIIPMAFMIFFSSFKNMKLFYLLIAFFFVSLVTVYILRLTDPACDIVNVWAGEGVLWKFRH